jgi:heme oxygenase
MMDQTDTPAATTIDAKAVGAVGPPLYGRLMKAIATGHTFGNRVRMIKLPLIFTDPQLYAAAIGQFFWLTETLEIALARYADHPMIQRIQDLGLVVTPGFAADLKQMHGANWRDKVERDRTSATSAYCEIISCASPVELVAAAFILYGALVVGGGKQTQAKVRKVFPQYDHNLFDVADDIKVARQRFKSTFTAIGREWPEHFQTLECEAARFMALNNTVVLSIRCWGRRATAVTVGVFAASLALVLARRWTKGTMV